jgi:hypothetical protein
MHLRLLRLLISSAAGLRTNPAKVPFLRQTLKAASLAATVAASATAVAAPPAAVSAPAGAALPAALPAVSSPLVPQVVTPEVQEALLLLLPLALVVAYVEIPKLNKTEAGFAQEVPPLCATNRGTRLGN